MPRVTQGVRFSADPRHADANIALTGVWLGDQAFQLTFGTLDLIDAGTLTFAFGSDSVTITLEERTLLGGPIFFVAH